MAAATSFTCTGRDLVGDIRLAHLHFEAMKWSKSLDLFVLVLKLKCAAMMCHRDSLNINRVLFSEAHAQTGCTVGMYYNSTGIFYTESMQCVQHLEINQSSLECSLNEPVD